MLQVEDLNVYYGAIHALQGVSFNVNEGEIVTLIGANGAGKSTTLKTISGLLHPREGGIKLDEQTLDKVPPHEIAASAICEACLTRSMTIAATV